MGDVKEMELQEELDQEWLLLIEEARQLGLSYEDIHHFFTSRKPSN
ncbi:DNA-binding anti-repressor SinI [Bacillus weihaiensis]|nr:DNA-binding anti-repressor SinI [Bacillus weihaiensis]